MAKSIMKKKFSVCAGDDGIYAGSLKSPFEWEGREEVTDQALWSVASYMAKKHPEGGAEYWVLSDGTTMELSIRSFKNYGTKKLAKNPLN